MMSLALSIVALALGIYALIGWRRAWHDVLGVLLWAELRAGYWDVPRYAWRRELPACTSPTVKFRRHNPFGERP